MKVLVCFEGKSGVGKTTLANFIEDNYGIEQVITHTTREPRGNERGYIFSDKNLYHIHKNEGRIFEEIFFNNNTYWTLKDDYEFEGIRTIAVEPNGIKQIKANVKADKIIVIRLELSALERFIRMYRRSRNTGTSISKSIKKSVERLSHDRKAFKKSQANFILPSNMPVEELYECIKPLFNVE
jgi:guanylate kinase